MEFDIDVADNWMITPFEVTWVIATTEDDIPKLVVRTGEDTLYVKFRSKEELDSAFITLSRSQGEMAVVFLR